MVIIEEGAIKPDITGCDECGKETRCIEFKGGGYLYCLDCLRTAVALLEGQKGQSKPKAQLLTDGVCWACEESITESDPGIELVDGAFQHQRECELVFRKKD